MSELDPALPKYERALRFGTIIMASGALLLWALPALLNGHENLIVHSILFTLFLLLALGAWCVLVVLSIVLAVFTASVSWRRRIAAACHLIVLLLFIAVAWPMVQRYSQFGVLFFGGADYWVSKAVEANSDQETLRAIGIIIDADKNHGGAIAHESLRAHYARPTQKRLLTLLASHPPRESWRSYFQGALDTLEEQEKDAQQSKTTEP